MAPALRSWIHIARIGIYVWRQSRRIGTIQLPKLLPIFLSDWWGEFLRNVTSAPLRANFADEMQFLILNAQGVCMNTPAARASISSGSDHYFDDDLHKLSHDLRNPLNHISGFAELLLMDEGLSPAHADYVRAILTGSDALSIAVISYLDRTEAPAPNRVAATSRKAFPETLHRRRRSLFRRSAGPARNFRSFARSEPA